MKFLKKIIKSETLFRFFDILISLLLICIFSPLIFVIAVCIKVGDFKSSVFAENHMRVGRNGKLFFMYKFRTMIPHAHELLHSDPRFSDLKKKHDANGAKLRIEDDIRITPVGRVLRRFDLDELPQLFNVFKGDMSMVGWRAYFKHEVDSYSRQYPEFREKIKSVFKIKPGVTGLWQISGRNLLSIPQRISCDYEYFEKKSILFYILILLKTPYIVITRYGAYD
jgi:exopolysaccharide production protein ExoY